MSKNIISAAVFLLVALSSSLTIATELTGKEADLIEGEMLEEMLNCNEALKRMPNAKPEKRLLLISGHFDKNSDRTKPIFFCLFGNKRKLSNNEVQGVKIVNPRQHVITQEEEETLLQEASNSQYPASILLIDPLNYLHKVEVD